MVDLSIIIPHYNRPKMLRKLLNSIPCMENIQVIVVDDKSEIFTQEYVNLVADFSNRNIFFAKNNTGKKGAGTCRNIGLKISTGRYVLFADSDDYFSENFYSIVSKYFKSEYDIVFFTPQSISLIEGVESKRHKRYSQLIKRYLYKRRKQEEILLRCKFHVPWSKLYLRSFLTHNQIKFQEVSVSNDVMFSIKAGHLASKISADTQTIYIVTESGDSLTSIKQISSETKRFDVYIDYINYLDAHNIKLGKMNNFTVKLKFIVRIFLTTHSINMLTKYAKKMFGTETDIGLR